MSKIIDQIALLASGAANKIVITSLNTAEAERYASVLSQSVQPNARLVITQDDFRHLLNSGHLTGHGRANRIDRNPLSPSDLEELKEVFKTPDQIYSIGSGRLGLRVKVEKKFSNRHRLIMELEQAGNVFRLITYFNINKKPPSQGERSGQGLSV